MLASLPLSSQTLAAKRGPPKVLTRQQRDATEDAVCKVHICGEEGSGVLVSWAGYTAVLTGNKLIPDRQAAAKARFVFNVKGIGSIDIQIASDSLMLFSPSTELDYTFAVIPCPPGLIPVSLNRGQDCGVWQGDSVSLLQQNEDGGKDVWVGFVVRVSSPWVYYDAVRGTGSEGGPLFQNYEAVALHKGRRNPEKDVDDDSKGGFFAAVSCAPVSSRHGQSKGVLLSAILDDLSERIWKKKEKQSMRNGQEARGGNGERGEEEKGEEGESEEEDGWQDQVEEGASSVLTGGKDSVMVRDLTEKIGPECVERDHEQSKVVSGGRWGSLRRGYQSKPPGKDLKGKDENKNSVSMNEDGLAEVRKVTAAESFAERFGRGFLSCSVSRKESQARSPLVGAGLERSGGEEKGHRLDPASTSERWPGGGEKQTVRASFKHEGKEGSVVSRRVTPQEELCGVSLSEKYEKTGGNSAQDISGLKHPVHALDDCKCGVGLVLGAWKPKGLAYALNIVSGTHERVRVDKVVKDGPADYAIPKIQAGDVIKAVGEERATGIGKVVELLRGEEGSHVSVIFSRNGYEFVAVLKRGLTGGYLKGPVHGEDLKLLLENHRQVGGSIRGHHDGVPHQHSHTPADACEHALSSRSNLLFFEDLSRIQGSSGTLPNGPYTQAQEIVDARSWKDSMKAEMGAKGSSTEAGNFDLNGANRPVDRVNDYGSPPGIVGDRSGAVPAGVTRWGQEGAHAQNGDLKKSAQDGGDDSGGGGLSGDGVWGSLKSIASSSLGGKAAPKRLKDPKAAFRDMCLTRLHGEIAKEGAGMRELSRELMDKARIGDVPCVRVLLVRGAEANFVDDESLWGGATPLIQAACGGSTACVSVLVSAGANVDSPDECGWTPLHRSCGLGHVSVVKVLISAKARVSVRDCNGMTPLELARLHGHTSVVAVLTGTPMEYPDMGREVRALKEELRGGGKLVEDVKWVPQDRSEITRRDDEVAEVLTVTDKSLASPGTQARDCEDGDHARSQADKNQGMMKSASEHQRYVDVSALDSSEIVMTNGTGEDESEGVPAQVEEEGGVNKGGKEGGGRGEKTDKRSGMGAWM